MTKYQQFCMNYNSIIISYWTNKMFSQNHSSCHLNKTMHIYHVNVYMIFCCLQPVIQSYMVDFFNENYKLKFNCHNEVHMKFASMCCASVFVCHSMFHTSVHCPWEPEWNVRWVILELILVIDGWGISCEIALRWIILDFTDDRSTLV